MDIWGQIYVDPWRDDPHPHAFHRDDGNINTVPSAASYFVAPRGVMGNTFGIGRRPDTLPRRLERLRAVLAPNGRLLVSMIDPLATEDPAHLAYHARNRAAGRPPGLARARLEYRGATGDWWELWMPTEPELTAAASAAKWTITGVVPEGISRLYELVPGP